MRIPKYHIRPSRDFTQRTISQIRAVRQRRQFWFDLSLPVLAFSPVLLRQLWMWLGYHHNYFKPGHWPVFGHFVSQSYVWFVSGLTVYLLLAGGTAWLAWHFLRSRRLQLALRIFGQLLRFDWLRP